MIEDDELLGEGEVSASLSNSFLTGVVRASVRLDEAGKERSGGGQGGAVSIDVPVGLSLV